MIKSPLKAIRKYCLWCCGESALEVRLCPAYDCPLHPFRFGRKPKKVSSALKAIKERCFNCSGFEKKQVRECPFPECPLYPYRLGKNPKRKGIGGKKNTGETLPQRETIVNQAVSKGFFTKIRYE